MLTLLLAASLAHADTPPDTSASGSSPPSEAASTTAPSGTASAPAPAPATPSATAPGSDASSTTASGTPTDATAPSPAATTTTATTPGASADPSAPDPHAVRRFRRGKSIATAGAVMLPAGVLALGVAMNQSLNGGNPVLETALFVGGAAGIVGAAPTFLTGVYVERSGVRLAGCTPRDQGWRHAPLVLAGAGAVATQFGIELGTDAVAPTLLAAGVGTGVVQHVLLQKDARDCGLRD